MGLAPAEPARLDSDAGANHRLFQRARVRQFRYVCDYGEETFRERIETGEILLSSPSTLQARYLQSRVSSQWERLRNFLKKSSGDYRISCCVYHRYLVGTMVCYVDNIPFGVTASTVGIVIL